MVLGENNREPKDIVIDMLKSRVVRMNGVDVTEKTKFGDDLHFDYYDFVDFVVACEEEFKANGDSIVDIGSANSFRKMTVSEFCENFFSNE